MKAVIDILSLWFGLALVLSLAVAFEGILKAVLGWLLLGG
jgi:hypothetical protein